MLSETNQEPWNKKWKRWIISDNVLTKCFFEVENINIKISWWSKAPMFITITCTSWSLKYKVNRGRDIKISYYYRIRLLSAKSTLLGQTVTLGGNLFWWTRQVISILISMSEMFENIYFGSPVLIIPGFPG